MKIYYGIFKDHPMRIERECVYGQKDSQARYS